MLSSSIGSEYRSPGVRMRRAFIAFVLLSMCGSAAAATKNQLEAISHDGLELTKSSKVDVLYKRPGATLESYTKLMLDPVSVAFKKNWKPSTMQVSSSDRERIRSDVAEEFRKVFSEELQQKGSYQIVDAPGPDVLRVSAAIVDLYINAPDTMQAGRSRTYTTSAGEMTLIAELRDSDSGQILARAADRKNASSSSFMTWTNSVTNTAEARRIMQSWAKTLRGALDAAREE
jgi:hypothetical protein